MNEVATKTVLDSAKAALETTKRFEYMADDTRYWFFIGAFAETLKYDGLLPESEVSELIKLLHEVHG